jgi:hypothetical protein
MVRSISVGTLVTQELLDYARKTFPELMSHPDFREDALQELTLVELGETLESEEKVEVARRSLTWLAYELGVNPDRPAFPRVDYIWLKEAVTGTLIRDLEALGGDLPRAA